MPSSPRPAQLGLLAVIVLFLSTFSFLGFRAHQNQSLTPRDDFQLSLSPDGRLLRPSFEDAPLAAITARDAKPSITLAQGR